MAKYGIALITDYQRYLGFRIASLSSIFYVSTVEEGNELVKKLWNEKKYGLILVSSHVYNTEDDEIKSLIRKTFPLIVEIPISGTNFAMLEESKIIDYLRKSIGYSIKF